jgi:hypothetical protein
MRNFWIPTTFGFDPFLEKPFKTVGFGGFWHKKREAFASLL